MAVISISLNASEESLSATSDAKLNSVKSMTLAQLKKENERSTADLKIAYKINALDEKINALHGKEDMVARAYQAAKTVAVKTRKKQELDGIKAQKSALRKQIKELKEKLHEPKNRNLSRIRNHQAVVSGALRTKLKEKGSKAAPVKSTPTKAKPSAKITKAEEALDDREERRSRMEGPRSGKNETAYYKLHDRLTALDDKIEAETDSAKRIALKKKRNDLEDKLEYM